ncbi:hypothetical protein HZS_698 [Henneguya salminicola]|nr:hypothetical protein HZS_698 [Henneguya salminicola]
MNISCLRCFRPSRMIPMPYLQKILVFVGKKPSVIYRVSRYITLNIHSQVLPSLQLFNFSVITRNAVTNCDRTFLILSLQAKDYITEIKIQVFS